MLPITDLDQNKTESDYNNPSKKLLHLLIQTLHIRIELEQTIWFFL